MVLVSRFDIGFTRCSSFRRFAIGLRQQHNHIYKVSILQFAASEYRLSHVGILNDLARQQPACFDHRAICHMVDAIASPIFGQILDSAHLTF